MRKIAPAAIAVLLLLLAAASAQKSDEKNNPIANGFAEIGNGTANETDPQANNESNPELGGNGSEFSNETIENPTGTGYGGADIGTGGTEDGNGGAELGGGKGEGAGAPPIDGYAGELGMEIARNGPMVEVSFDNVLRKKGTFYSGIIRPIADENVYFEVNRSGGEEWEYPPTVAAMIMPGEKPKPDPPVVPNPSIKPNPQMKPESPVRRNYDVWYSLPGDDSFARVTVEVTCASASEGSRCSFQYPLMYNGEFRVDALDSNGRLVGRESRWVEIAYATRETFYVNGAGKLLASMSTGQLVFYHHDYLGNVVRKTGLSGVVVASTEYKPFGEVLSETGESRYKYNSKELDSQIGLYYYGSRYYDAAIGRFTTADTVAGRVADPQSLNRYSYVKNNPMRFVDPTGNAPEKTGDRDYDSLMTVAGPSYAVNTMEAGLADKIAGRGAAPDTGSLSGDFASRATQMGWEMANGRGEINWNPTIGATFPISKKLTLANGLKVTPKLRVVYDIANSKVKVGMDAKSKTVAGQEVSLTDSNSMPSDGSAVAITVPNLFEVQDGVAVPLPYSTPSADQKGAMEISNLVSTLKPPVWMMYDDSGMTAQAKFGPVTVSAGVHPTFKRTEEKKEEEPQGN